MNKVEGVIEGIVSSGKAIIVNSKTYGAFEESHWQGAKVGDRVEFMYNVSRDGKWNNAVTGSIIVYKADRKEFTKEDILEARRVALPLAASSVTDITNVYTLANGFVDYLLGKDLGIEEKRVATRLDEFDFDVPQ